MCIECIDNSECLGCHTKINEKKFAQSVHGALSCNGCHWDITDVKAHLKAKGSKIQAEPITCHRCHKKEGAEHYASAHFINDVQCKDCHQEIHEMTAWKGDKVRVIEKCTTCHSDDGYAQSVHGKGPSGATRIPRRARTATVSTRFPFLRAMNRRWSNFGRSSTPRSARSAMRTRR